MDTAEIRTDEHLLLEEIEAFLAESGMGVTYFGKRSVGNSELVKRLRGGETVTLETARKARQFIRDRRAARKRT